MRFLIALALLMTRIFSLSVLYHNLTRNHSLVRHCGVRFEDQTTGLGVVACEDIAADTEIFALFGLLAFTPAPEECFSAMSTGDEDMDVLLVGPIRLVNHSASPNAAVSQVLCPLFADGPAADDTDFQTYARLRGDHHSRHPEG